MVDDLTNTLPLGDLNYLKHIASITSVTKACELVACAPAAVEKEMNSIRNAFSQNDTEQLKNACHALRGACYSVQVNRLAAITKEMELVASDIAQAQEYWSSMETISNETVIWLESILENDLLSE